MGSQPQTWHYGLVAQYWAEFNTSGGEDLAYIQRFIEADGQPALDLACGTGRLLLPLIQAGLDVDGCDISPDMLALCEAQARQAGLSPGLYTQPFHMLDLPRAYRTIYICDSFGIGGQRQQDEMGLERCYHHLAPGGTLLFNHYLPYGNADEWGYWLPESQSELPEAWPSSGRRRQAANGDEYEFLSRRVELDPLTQRLTRQVRISLWRDGQQVAQEEYILHENLYFCQEVLALLEKAGFADITVKGGYTGAEATAEDIMVVFIARK